MLGKGAFGVVHLAQDKRGGGLYACKSISKAKLISKEDVEDVRREVGAPGCTWVLASWLGAGQLAGCRPDG